VSASLTAATITGQFTVVGTVSITASGLIQWTSSASDTVNGQANISSSATLTGSFVGLGNQAIDINTLTDGPDPSIDQTVNMPFSNYNFIGFPGDPTFPELQANFIPEGSGGSNACSTDVALAVEGQTCTLNAATTPGIPGGSPFTFLNTETSINQQLVCCTSSATWDISGVTSDGTANWNGQFTATFVVPFQQVLNNFVTNGQVLDAYSGVVVVDPIAIQDIPEPSILSLMSVGFAVVMLFRFSVKCKGAALR
jgi:hypothetical protein